MMQRMALILGVTGGIGGAVTRRLVKAGWRVRALTRGASSAIPDGVERIVGDALDAPAVTAAAAGADVIVHAVNPPGYRDWDTLVLPMLDSTLAAARASGARIVLPGNVYNYGPDVFPLIHEDAPQHPVTSKGAIRVELERRIRAAVEAGHARALIVCAGDFFGPGAANTWFGQAVVTPGTRPQVIRNPGRPGIGHQWAFLPDVAETMVRLLDRPGIPAFARYHMDGHWDADGCQMVEAIARVLGNPMVPIRPFPWWQIRLAARITKTPRELLKMDYLWRRPVRMANERLLQELSVEPHTPLDTAVRSTLVGMGCFRT